MSQVKKEKKKATRACQSCQKAHLTCDDGLFFFIVLENFYLIRRLPQIALVPDALNVV